MPFISVVRRGWWDELGLKELCEAVRGAQEPPEEEGPSLMAGDLAYLVYSLLVAAAPPGARFEQRNAMMGAVDEARLTYRRLFHDDAEDEARAKNGDIP